MSVVGNVHRVRRNGKVIFKALSLLSIAAGVLYTVVGISGCKNVDKVSDSLIFRYNEDASVTTLDPAYVKSQSELWIASQIFNGLIDLDTALQPVPMLAKSWEILNNGTVYKFHLRKDVRFHGQVEGGFEQPRWVTARDVVYSFTRLVDPAVASPGAWIFSDKTIVDSALHAVIPQNNPFYAPDDSTFVLTLIHPNSAVLSQLGTAYCYIIPNQSATAEKASSFGRKPVGTGPFYLKLWEEDVKLVLRRNQHYFEFDEGKRLPFLEAVNVDFIKSKQTAFMKFVAGEFDFFNGIESSFKDELLDKNGRLQATYQGKFQMIQRAFLNTEYLGFWLGKHRDSAFLSDLRVRKALNMAIDRKTLVKYLRNGLGATGNSGFVPPVLLTHNVQGYSYNQQQASDLLKDAGYTQGKGAPVLTLTTTADYLDMAVYIRKYWESLGLKVKIDVQTGGMLRQMRNKGDLIIFRGSWIADYSDPENYLACFYSPNFSPSGPNYTHFKSAEFDRLYEMVLKSTDITERNGYLTQADSVLIHNAPLVVLYYDKSLRLYHSNVQNLTNDAANRLVLKRVYKTR